MGPGAGRRILPYGGRLAPEADISCVFVYQALSLCRGSRPRGNGKPPILVSPAAPGLGQFRPRAGIVSGRNWRYNRRSNRPHRCLGFAIPLPPRARHRPARRLRQASWLRDPNLKHGSTPDGSARPRAEGRAQALVWDRTANRPGRRRRRGPTDLGAGSLALTLICYTTARQANTSQRQRFQPPVGRVSGSGSRRRGRRAPLRRMAPGRRARRFTSIDGGGAGKVGKVDKSDLEIPRSSTGRP